MDQTNTQAALNAGEAIGGLKAAGTIHRVVEGGTPFLLLLAGQTPHSVEKYLPAPLQKRVALDVRDHEGFLVYVSRFADEGSIVFANPENLTFTAILDYHLAVGALDVTGKDAAGARTTPGSPRWGRHKATLTCRLTEPWKAWDANDGTAMSQTEFARLIEDRIVDIAEPAGAEIYEMVRSLEARKTANFSSSVRLQDGQNQLTYEETIDASSQKGTVKIPNAFVLGLQPFEGAAKYRLEARFRFRIENGRLLMWYDLLRPDDILREAFSQVRLLIEQGSAAAR